MADDEEKATETTVDTGTQPGERKFSQADVDKIVKERIRKEFKREEKRVAERAEKEAKPDKPSRRELDANKADKSDFDKVREELAEERRARERGEFENHILRDGRFREDAAEKLWKLHSADKPKDRKAWFDEMHTLGAFVKAPAKQEETTTQNETQGKEKKGATAPSAPSTAPAPPTVNGGLTDIWNMTPTQLASYSPQQLRGEFEKILEVGKQLTGAPPRPRVPGK